MNPEALAWIRELVERRAGIVLPPAKDYLVATRMPRLAQTHDLPTVEALVDAARARPALQTAIVEAMTTNETSFFRDVNVFTALEKEVLPELIAARRAQRRLRIWCAACSTGQEPYSLSMLLDDALPDAGWDVSILATDLCSKVLAQAASGVFSRMEVNRGLPARMLVRHFEREGDSWRVKAGLRQRMRFTQMNLIEPWPRDLGTFDLILLRNVLIYFDVATKKRLLGHTHDILRADGVLLLGSGETTLGLDDRFACERSGGCTTYRHRATTSKVA